MTIPGCTFRALGKMRAVRPTELRQKPFKTTYISLRPTGLIRAPPFFRSVGGTFLHIFRPSSTHDSHSSVWSLLRLPEPPTELQKAGSHEGRSVLMFGSFGHQVWVGPCLVPWTAWTGSKRRFCATRNGDFCKA